MELIGRTRTPTNSELQRIHDFVEDLLLEGVPETFRYVPAGGEMRQRYSMWPQKLAPKTWELLWSRGLTGDAPDHAGYPLKEAAGLSLMAIIADVLAGQTRTRITDRGLAYATITNAPKSTTQAQEPCRVVPLTFKGLGLEHIPIERLVAFREKEEKSGGSAYRALRHKYLSAVEQHLNRISTVEVGSADREELDRAFAQDMEDDLCDLKTELGVSKREALLSKDVMSLVIAGGTLLTTAAAATIPVPEVFAGAGGAVLLGGLLSAGNKFAKSRYDILRRHPMAYLYQLQP